MIVDLTRGVHTIAVAVDLAHRREGIRCVLEDIRVRRRGHRRCWASEVPVGPRRVAPACRLVAFRFKIGAGESHRFRLPVF